MTLNTEQHDPAVLTPQNEPRVPVKHEAERVGEEKKSLRLPGNRTTIPRLPSLQCSQCCDCTVPEKFDMYFMLDTILCLIPF